MNYDTLCIKNITDAANLTSQHNIDADIILPDYYDTIGKILKSEITPLTEAVTSSGDKLSVAGIARFTMIYIGEDNRMYCYENDYKYTKVFQSQYIEGCLTSSVKQTVFSLGCRAIAPKRIELRAVLQIGVKIRCEASLNLISSIDDNTIITRCENVCHLTPINCVSRNLILTGSYPINDFNEKFDIIISKETKINITELKTIRNKAYIKGVAQTEILHYSNVSGNVASEVLNIPLSEIIDIFGAEDDDICKVSFNDIYTEAVLNELNSDACTLDIRVTVDLQAQVSRIICGDIISDMYSLKNEIFSSKETVKLIAACKNISKTENITFETDIYEDSKIEVIDCRVSNIRTSSDEKSNGFSLLVTGLFCALIKNEYGSYSIISREHTYETELICDMNENEIVNPFTRVLSVSALQVKDGKIRFSADLLSEAECLTVCKASGFTAIEVNNDIKSENSSIFTIYFAKQNEDVWSVAKEHRTSVEAIKEINKLSGDRIIEDKMLLLPSF